MIAQHRLGWLLAVAAACLLWFPLSPLPASNAQVPAEPLRFTGIEPASTNRAPVVQLAVPPNTTYALESSSNLVQWTPILTARASGTVRHTNTDPAVVPAQFFRATVPAMPPALTGDHVVTQDGIVTVHPVNHASLVLGWKDTVIYNDPVGGAAAYNGLPRPNLILVSHSHGDHFDSATLNAIRQSTTLLITPASIYTGLSAALKSVAIPLSNGQSTNVLGVLVEAVPAYNANHPKGVGNGYVVTLGGKRFYFSGDTEDVAEMKALSQIDVAFLCMNVPFTMTVDRAAGAVRAFRPGIVYPYHFRNQNGSFADLNSFRRQVGTDVGVEVRVRKWY